MARASVALGGWKEFVVTTVKARLAVALEPDPPAGEFNIQPKPAWMLAGQKPRDNWLWASSE